MNDEFTPENGGPKENETQKRGGRKISVLVFVVSLFLAVVITGLSCFAVFSRAISKEHENLGFLREVQRLDSMYRQYYVGNIDYDLITERLLRTYVASIDKYGYYLSGDEYSELVDSLNSSSSGMGVYVVERINGVEIVHIMANSPAEKAGLQVGDVIYKSNGVYYSEMSYSDFVGHCRGEEGTTGTVEFIRDGEAYSTEITYSKFYIETVFRKNLGDGVGYILVISFDDGTASDFRKAVEDLKSVGCDRIIFDLRGNGGGRLDTVTNMLDYIMGEGVIVTITDSEGKVVESYSSDPSDAIGDMPVAVLINGGTASASELFACALRDSKDALLVGENSYGKGTMQLIMSFGGGAGVGITTNFFNPPKTPNFDGVGLAPDIEAHLTTEGQYYSIFTRPYEADAQLQAAVEAIKAK